MSFAFYSSRHHPPEEGAVISCISHLGKLRLRWVQRGIPGRNKVRKDPLDSQGQSPFHFIPQRALSVSLLPPVPKAAGNRYPPLSVSPWVQALLTQPLTHGTHCVRPRGCSHSPWPQGTHSLVGDVERHWINETGNEQMNTGMLKFPFCIYGRCLPARTHL